MLKTKSLWRLLGLSMAGLLLFTACKGEDSVAEQTISPAEQSPEPSPAADPYTVEPNSADAVLEAYLLCLKDGELEKAQQYIWPMAEDQPGEAMEAFWQPFVDAGYLALDSYTLNKTGESDLYTTYNVDLSFTLPEGAERSAEAVASGDTIFMPPAPEEIRMAQEAEAEAEAAARSEEGDQPLDHMDLAGENSSEAADEENAESENENAEESNGEETPEDEGTEEATPESLTPGYETVLLTIVHADNRYYVSPQNLLAVYEATDTRPQQELEHEWAQEIENGLAEVENRTPTTVDVPEIEGVYAQLVAARRYADSLSLDIRFENYNPEPYVMGEADFPPVLEMEGVFMGLDPFASPQLAMDFGFTPLSPETGAKAGHFTTFTPDITLEPGAPEASVMMENIRFVGNYEVVYTLFFPDFDDGVLAVSLENMEALPGYLPVRNPFADFEAPAEGTEGDEDDALDSALATEESAAAIGIIGGADGPTEIIVTGSDES